MSIYRVGMAAARNARRFSSNSASVHPGYNKIEPVKQKFNVEDGSPIFVKSGSVDRIAYGLTTLACVAAVGLNVKLYWDLSQK